MILYVNGDSHSAGHDAGGPDFAYGRHLANALNSDYVCDAVSGCSNDSIIERTLKYLESTTPDFVVIGWSTWERETWYWNGTPYNFTSSGTDLVHPMLQDFYKEWVIANSRPNVQRQKERDAHLKIYLLHKYLQSKQIKHLFFNAYNFFFYTHSYNDPKYYWGDRDENFLHPYDIKMTYYDWLKQHGFKMSNPESFHYGADAHQAWAEFILPKIQSMLTKNI